MIDDERIEPRLSDALNRAVPQHEPPGRLRGRVLASAGAVKNVSSPRVRVSPRIDRLAAVAALLLVAVATFGWWSTRQEMRRLTEDLVFLREEVQRVEALLARGERNQVEIERAMRVLMAPDVTRVHLEGGGPAPTSSGYAYVSSEGIFLLARGLPAAPPSRSYQLWVIDDGQPASAAVFAASIDEPVRVVGEITRLPIDAVAVTLEPQGGVQTPTGPQVLVGKVAR